MNDDYQLRLLGAPFIMPAWPHTTLDNRSIQDRVGPGMNEQEISLACRVCHLDQRCYKPVILGSTTRTVAVYNVTLSPGTPPGSKHRYVFQPAPEPLELYSVGWTQLKYSNDITGLARRFRVRFTECSYTELRGHYQFYFDNRLGNLSKVEAYAFGNILGNSLTNLYYLGYGQPPESLKNMNDHEIILHFLRSIDPHVVSFFNLVTNPDNQEWQADLLFDNSEHGFIEADGLHVIHFQGGAIYDLVDKAEQARLDSVRADYELECWLEPRDV